MPNPYQEDQNRTGAPRYESRGSHPDQYRRGDAPFQFPLWSIIVTFCVGMWPVAIAFIVLNNLLRSGVFNWEPRPSRKIPAPRTARSPPLWSRAACCSASGPSLRSAACTT